LYLDYILKDKGFKVLSTGNLDVALDLVKRNEPVDLILIILNSLSKELNETTRLIKKIKPEIPIVFQTSIPITENDEKLVCLSCDILIKKPLNIKELNTVINDCLFKSKVK
jgi:DNA-binding response OmpR family regulator